MTLMAGRLYRIVCNKCRIFFVCLVKELRKNLFFCQFCWFYLNFTSFYNCYFFIQVTKQFIEIVNELRSKRNTGPIAWNSAVKFLMARKFDVRRAVALYEIHEVRKTNFLLKLFFKGRHLH